MSSGHFPTTEAVDPATEDLDLLETDALVARFVNANLRAVTAVSAVSAFIAEAVEKCVATLASGGTIFYVGAGTSGRLAALDAAELYPTFGLPEGRVRAIIAGGSEAMLRAIEGAEDDRAAGTAAMADVRAGDTVIAISASGSAAYVVAALTAARANGATAVGVMNTLNSPLEATADIAIVLATGPEPIAGSTRLVAGTSAKLVLNALSSATMVRLGKTYGNLMVDLVATNAKLRARSVRIVARATRMEEAAAALALADAGGSVKTAIVMLAAGVEREAANARLSAAGGVVRRALES